jgi:hypothetical protein
MLNNDDGLYIINRLSRVHDDGQSNNILICRVEGREGGKCSQA